MAFLSLLLTNSLQEVTPQTSALSEELGAQRARMGLFSGVRLDVVSHFA